MPWRRVIHKRCPAARHPLNTADCGDSIIRWSHKQGGARARLRKIELRKVANWTGLASFVAHRPPGAGEWNRIEYRMFVFVSQNWRDKPLRSHQVMSGG
jgi:hypothetical protein